MKSIEIEINGKIERILAVPSKEGLWYHFKGETYFFQKAKTARGKREESAGGDIIAPMPGKVTKVLVREGQEVKKKQTLVVMEAMKMEYNLAAASDHRVKRVFCAEGDQVGQDQVLVEFERQAGEQAR